MVHNLKGSEVVGRPLQLVAQLVCLACSRGLLCEGPVLHALYARWKVFLNRTVVEVCDVLQVALTMLTPHVLRDEAMWPDDAVEDLARLSTSSASTLGKQMTKVPLTNHPASNWDIVRFDYCR
jgi:hypothetical protein